MMRDDEEFTKNAIVNFLGKEWYATEGENPPDYYLIKGETKIALEITTASPKFLSTNGVLENRRTVDSALERMCNELNRHYEGKISAGISILIHISGPVFFFKDFKRNLKRFINDYLEKDFLNAWHYFIINNERIKIKKIYHGQSWRKRIVCIIANKSSIPYIEVHTKMILQEIISQKNLLLGHDQYEKWLGILNNYQSADENNFISAISNLNCNHRFSKIFIVFDENRVLETNHSLT